MLKSTAGRGWKEYSKSTLAEQRLQQLVASLHCVCACSSASSGTGMAGVAGVASPIPPRHNHSRWPRSFTLMGIIHGVALCGMLVARAPESRTASRHATAFTSYQFTSYQPRSHHTHIRPDMPQIVPTLFCFCVSRGLVGEVEHYA